MATGGVGLVEWRLAGWSRWGGADGGVGAGALVAPQHYALSISSRYAAVSSQPETAWQLTPMALTG